ncbi:MAG: transposase [Coriobacteriia bacterium]|nr:transposase [Coriobacteriia bacterium]
MPRQARVASEYQHVITRGNGKQAIFEEEADFEYYLSLLKRFAEDTGVVVLAYCLMDNHVHLLIHDAQTQTPLFMKKLGVTYAMYFNKKYGRKGPLFHDRYRSEALAKDEHLLAAYRYILNNPVKAGVASADKYPWSSYRDYASANGITNTELQRSLIGDKAAFRKFMVQEDSREFLDVDAPKHDDEWAKGVMLKTLGIKSGAQLQELPKKERDAALAALRQAGLSVRQTARLTGISQGVVQRAK